MKSNIYPLFSSHYSIGKSILTLDKPEEIKSYKPVSIFSIAKTYKLKEIFLVETGLSGFVEAYNISSELKIPFRFGLKLNICNDIKDKSEESKKSESKIVLWMKNSDAYKDILQIHNKATIDGFYYYPRLDWINLEKCWTKNLILTFPFYANFLHNNYLRNGTCLPSFSFCEKPIFFEEDNDLAFNILIKSRINDYCINNNYEIKKCKSIYYNKKEDFISYITFKCIHNRSCLDKPELKYCSDNNFSFESYLEQIRN